MNSSPVEQIIKAKRQTYRDEIRKQDLNSKMLLKRQLQLENNEMDTKILLENNFPKFLSHFKFMQNYEDVKDVPNKNYFEIYQEILKSLVDEDYKGNIFEIVNCLTLARKLTMEVNTISAKELIHSGILCYIEKYLDLNFLQYYEIQQEACWIVSNICAPENIDISFLWTTKIAYHIVSLLKSTNKEVLFNVIWALSNISGDSLDYRNKLLENSGIIDSLIGVILRLKNKSDPLYDKKFLGEALWLVSNLCRGKPYPPYELVSKFLEIIPDCFNHLTFQNCEHAIWILYYLTESEQIKIKNFMKYNMIGFLINFAKEPNMKVKLPALRVLGNISSSDDQDVHILLDNNMLEVLELNFNDQNKYLRKEVAWMIANILASGNKIIQRVLDHSIYNLMRSKSLHDDIIIRKELIIAFSNGTQNATIDQLFQMIDNDIIYILMSGLDIQDPKTLIAILDAVDNLLVANQESNKSLNNYGIVHNRIYDELEKYKIIQVLDELQKFPVKEVYDKAFQIIDRHFSSENMN